MLSHMAQVYELGKTGDQLLPGRNGEYVTPKKYYDELFEKSIPETRVRFLDGSGTTPNLRLIEHQRARVETDVEDIFTAERPFASPEDISDILVHFHPDGTIIIEANSEVEQTPVELIRFDSKQAKQLSIRDWPTPEKLKEMFAVLSTDVVQQLSRSEKNLLLEVIGRIKYLFLAETVLQNKNFKASDLEFMQISTDLSEDTEFVRKTNFPGFAQLPSLKLLATMEALPKNTLSQSQQAELPDTIDDLERDRIMFSRGFEFQDRIDPEKPASAELRKAPTNNHMEVISNSRLANLVHTPNFLPEDAPLKAAA